VHVESGMDIAALSPTLPFKSWWEESKWFDIFFNF
jgi:hypothetical protein